VAEEIPSEYDVLDGNWLACTRCGAAVWFSYMAIHSEWHQNTTPEVSENDSS